MITRLAVFLVTFTLEIHVYAAQVPMQEPSGCLKTANVCAIENHDERGFEFPVGGATITLDRDSAVIRKSEKEIRLVKGTVWIRAGDKPMTVSSEFGSAVNLGAGDFWIVKSANELVAIAVSAEVEIAPRGTGEPLTIHRGLQNTLGKVGFNGVASTGLPMPIAFKDHVLRWGRLYRGSKAAFEKQVGVFYTQWEEATQESAEVNKAVYDRKIASIENARRLEAEKKAKVQSENQVLRDLFRRRNGM
jgi:hypothetical protein